MLQSWTLRDGKPAAVRNKDKQDKSYITDIVSAVSSEETDSTMASNHLNVAIMYAPLSLSLLTGLISVHSGGGIGGLAFTIALAKARPEVSINLYESQAQFSEFGAGIGLWPRVQEVLCSLGLKEDLDRHAEPAETGQNDFSFLR